MKALKEGKLNKGGDMIEAMDVDLPADRLYRLLLDYLSTQPDMKVKRCLEPSLIEVNIGSWMSLRGNPPGTVDIKVHPRNGKSHVTFDFSFATWFITWCMIALLVLFICLPLGVTLWLPQIFVTVIVLFYFMPKDMGTAENKFTSRITNLFKGAEQPEPIVHEKPKLSLEEVYEKMLDAHIRTDGTRGKWLLERKIEKYVKQGFNQEEAIREVAIDEGYPSEELPKI